MSKLITIKTSGSFNKTTKFLNYVSGGKFIENKLKKYGEKGIEELRKNTPVDTGETSSSWRYEIEHDNNHVQITWLNDHMAGNVPVVILLQYGHATRGGGYVKGIDFINPAMKPIFDDILNEVWREVINA